MLHELPWVVERTTAIAHASRHHPFATNNDAVVWNQPRAEKFRGQQIEIGSRKKTSTQLDFPLAVAAWRWSVPLQWRQGSNGSYYLHDCTDAYGLRVVAFLFGTL